jgi:hypothetical protein
VQWLYCVEAEIIPVSILFWTESYGLSFDVCLEEKNVDLPVILIGQPGLPDLCPEL